MHTGMHVCTGTVTHTLMHTGMHVCTGIVTHTHTHTHTNLLMLTPDLSIITKIYSQDRLIDFNGHNQNAPDIAHRNQDCKKIIHTFQYYYALKYTRVFHYTLITHKMPSGINICTCGTVELKRADCDKPLVSLT